MRVLTVSDLKENDKRGLKNKNDYPRENSFAWEVLQQLKRHEGHSVDLRLLAHSRPIVSFYAAISQLTDMYGMDIRRLKKRSFEYVLAGEWFGSHYSDYCAREFHAGSSK